MLIKHNSIELYKPFQLFSLEDCEKIIHEASRQTEGIRSRTVNQNDKPAGRSSTTFWYKPTFFTADDLLPYFLPFVKDDYLVDWVQRPIQVARYEPSQFFAWHFDQLRGKRTRGRLLTLTCTLQQAQGAEIEVENHPFTLETGQAVIFPANVMHRATAPIKSDRWALTAWGLGTITKTSKRKDPRAKG